MQRLGTLLFFCAMLALPLLLGSILPGWGASAWASPAADGKAPEIFAAQRCDLCHGIERLDIAARSTAAAAAPDLSLVGQARDADSISAYLRGETSPTGEHRAWRGSDEDLEELAAWLAALR